MELLSPFAAVHRGMLFAWWLLGLAIVIWRRPQKLAFPRMNVCEALLLAGIGAIAGVVLYTALLSPPNSTDAMGYHMPRVLYWAQAGSVAFFPVHYYPQLTMPPLAEYFVLHTWVLSGGSDHYANLVQFGAMLGSLLVVAAIAGRLGASRRGQWVAAVFAATLPSGILQASGVKNDYVLALWIAAAIYFAMEWVQEGHGVAWFGCAAGLAMLTKGTAYILLPPLLAGATLAAWSHRKRRWWPSIAIAAGCALALNTPQFARNSALSGSPLGFRTAHGNDGDHQWRWSPDAITAGSATSNFLRFTAEHLGARSERWNRGVYDTVVAIHHRLGLDPEDPATTWRWTHYEPPRNSNHETNAANRWHGLLLLLLPLAIWRQPRWLIYWTGLALAYLAFCAALRWQPFMIRMQLPLFIAGAALAGAAISRLLPRWAELLLCLFLFNATRPYLFENWVRPLRGESRLLRVSRDQAYFNDMKAWDNRQSYFDAVQRVAASGCHDIGIDNSVNQLEYPFEALLRERDPRARFIHSAVDNLSARYPARPDFQPCVVVCLECAGDAARQQRYAPRLRPEIIGRWLLWF